MDQSKDSQRNQAQQVSSEADTADTPEAGPVVLQPRSDDAAQSQKGAPKKPIKLARRTFRPSHRATFIALAVIVVLIGANVAIVTYFIRKQAKSSTSGSLANIVLNKNLLDQLGVSGNAIGTGTESLVVSPNAVFNGTLSVEKDVKLGNNLTAGSTSITQLSAGNTSLTQLNVNGATTLGDTAFRSNVTVAGTSHLQGDVTIAQLLTTAGLTVTGNLTVGGSLTTSNFSAASLTSTTTLTIGGHIITGGSQPGVSTGAGVGPAGTVSISGNDTAGTIVINTGQSPAAGTLVNISFRAAYGAIPHVTITPIGPDPSSTAGVPLGYYVNRSTSGFSISTINSPAIGVGYVFDYHIDQ
ncbi:MAG: hypothetical protein ACHQUB_02610 [Candidatus Saccharimonadia bacterium]